MFLLSALLFLSTKPHRASPFSTGKLREFLFERGMRVQKWHRLVMLFHIKRWCLNSVQDYYQVCGSSLAQEKNGKRPGCIDVNHFGKISAVLPKNNHHKTSFLDIFMWQKMVQRKILLSLFDKVSLPLSLERLSMHIIFD